MKVKVRELFFSYPNFTLKVKDLNFESSKITSIVGPNGAGKSTFLKCLCMINTGWKGAVLINGEDLYGMKGSKRAQIIGYVPQEQNLIFNFSIIDFVLMGRTPYLNLLSKPSKKDLEMAEEALKFVGIKDYKGRGILELSSGERRLVLIARTIVQEPEILLMDEPTSFLDPKHEIEIMELIKSLSAKMGKTVILTLHNLDLAIKYSDNLVFMKEGDIVGSGRTQEVLSEEILEKVYDIKMKIVEINGHRVILR